MIIKAVVSSRKNEWKRDSGKRCDVQNGLLLQVSVKRPGEGQRVRSWKVAAVIVYSHSSVPHPLGMMKLVIVDSGAHFRS